MSKVNAKRTTAKRSKYVTSDGHSYLTKRVVVRKARAAGKKAASNAMAVMGYVVVAQDDVVIKKYADGTTEVIGPIVKANQ